MAEAAWAGGRGSRDGAFEVDLREGSDGRLPAGVKRGEAAMAELSSLVRVVARKAAAAVSARCSTD